MARPDTAKTFTAPASATVTLVEPIARESGPIETLTLRKPKAGELRGLNLQALVTADVNAVLTVLPRICDPFLTDPEVASLSAEDLAELGGTIAGFFMSPAQKAAVTQMLGG